MARTQNRAVKVTITGDAKGLSSSFTKSIAGGNLLAEAISNMAGKAADLAKTLVVDSVKAASTFETSLSRMQGLVGLTADEVAAFKDQILDLSGATAKAPQELADAMFFITSAGLRGSDAVDALTASAKASTAGLGATKDVAFAAVSAMNAYGAENLSASEAVDILTNIVRLGNVEAGEVAGVLGNIIPLAAEMGISFDQVGASLAAMTRLGADAASSATSLQAIMATLIKPSAKAEETLREFGLSSAELRKQVKDEGLLAVLTTLKESFGDNEEAIAKVFPNVRALRGVLNLVGQNAETTGEIFDSMGDSIGVLDEAFAVAAETSGFKFNQFMAELQTIAIDIGEQLLPAVLSLLEDIKPVLEDFGPVLAEVLGDLADLIALFGGPLKDAIEAVLAPMGALADAGNVVREVFDEDFRASEDLERVLGQLEAKLEDGADAVDSVNESFISLAADGALTADSLNSVVTAAELTDEQLLESLTRMVAYHEEYGSGREEMNLYWAALVEVEKELGVYGPQVRRVASLHREARAATKETTEATEDFGDTAEDAAEETKNLADELREAEENQRLLTDAVRAAANPLFGAIDALTRYEQILEDANEDQILTKDEALELAKAKLDLAAAFETLDTEQSTKALDALGLALGANRQEVVDLLAEFGIFVDEVGNISTSVTDGLLESFDGFGNRFGATVIGEITEGLDQVRSEFRIESPSKETKEQIGDPLIEGILAALAGGDERIRDALSGALSGVSVPGLGGGLSAGLGGSSGLASGATITVEVYIDSHQIIRAIEQPLVDRVRIKTGIGK